MTTSKMLMIAMIASNMFTLTRADYETNKGFIEGTGYMDQSRNYGYVYYYCGVVLEKKPPKNNNLSFYYSIFRFLF